MRKIYGNPLTTPIRPDKFGGEKSVTIKIQEEDFTAHIDGKYIDPRDNQLYNVGDCAITEPVAVKKGDIIHSISAGFNITSAIAYCNLEQTIFENVVTNVSNTEITEHNYVAEKDGYICFGYRKDFGGSYTVSQILSFEELINSKFDKTNIVHTIGDSKEMVMSQKAVTDAILQSGQIEIETEEVVYPETEFEANLTGKYINSNTNELQSASGFAITNPIEVKKGDVIISNSGGFNITAAIAYCNTEQTSFETVAANVSNTGATEHEYIAVKDGHICFGYHTDFGGYFSVTRTTTTGGGGSSKKNETITIGNSDKIGFFSNSFLNGYCMKTHHALDNISMFSDYILYNYGHSGYDAPMILDAINNNEKWLGDVPVQEWGLTYGVIAMQDNDVALYAINPETYYENVKKIAESVRAMGAIPILGTEHDNSNYYYGLQKLSEDEGYMLMNWGKTAAALTGAAWQYFAPFWYNSHPSTRTAWLWSNGMKKYLDTLPRPRKAIKLFKARPTTDTSDLNNLIYNDNVERAERFVEINRGAMTITDATEPYFDRISLANVKVEETKDDYQKLQSGNDSVAFGDYALAECVVPYTKNGIQFLKMVLDADGVTRAYIKKNISLRNPLPHQRYVAFGVTDGLDLLTVGTTFSVTGTFSQTLVGSYTVADIIDNIVITTTSSAGKTTSGTDVPVCSIAGVTMSGSYKYPTADYIERYKKPLAEWESIELASGGETDLSPYLAECMDYDKISILLVGSNITINDISFVVSGTAEKVNHTKKLTDFKVGTSLLANTLLDDGTAWENISAKEKYVPVVSTLDSSKYEYIPNGISSVRILGTGDTLRQELLTSDLNKNRYKNDKLQIRVMARYFPEYVNTDEKWATSEIFPGSYDCARMSIKLNDEAQVYSVPVGAYWNLYVFEMEYIDGNHITLTCEDKSLQIAMVECDIVE